MSPKQCSKIISQTEKFVFFFIHSHNKGKIMAKSMVLRKCSFVQQKQVDKFVEEYKTSSPHPQGCPCTIRPSIRLIWPQSTFTQWVDILSLHYGKWRDQATYLGVAAKRAQPTKFLTLWEHNCTCIEEVWDLEALHWLLNTKQNHCQEQVSNIMD